MFAGALFSGWWFWTVEATFKLSTPLKGKVMAGIKNYSRAQQQRGTSTPEKVFTFGVIRHCWWGGVSWFSGGKKMGKVSQQFIYERPEVCSNRRHIPKQRARICMNGYGESFILFLKGKEERNCLWPKRLASLCEGQGNSHQMCQKESRHVSWSIFHLDTQFLSEPPTFKVFHLVSKQCESTHVFVRSFGDAVGTLRWCAVSVEPFFFAWI